MLPITLSLLLLTAGPVPYDDAASASEQNGKPLVVLIGATWCPGCQTMKLRVLRDLERAGKLAGVNYAVLDLDTDRDLTDKLLQGTRIPQLVVFRKVQGGWRREHITGTASAAKVEGLLQRAAGK